MSEYLESALQMFKSYCVEREVSIGDHSAGELIIRGDVARFEQQDREVGLGKTRRPAMNFHFFDSVMARVAELKRRESEDTNNLFGGW